MFAERISSAPFSVTDQTVSPHPAARTLSLTFFPISDRSTVLSRPKVISAGGI